MNRYRNNYMSNNMQPMPRQMPVFQPQPIPPRTNKIFVSSLEEAMNKPVDFNSEFVYFDANKDFMYSIYTDEWGRKSAATFEISIPKAAEPPEQIDTADLLKRVKVLEEFTGVNNVKLDATSAPESSGANQ